MVDRQERPLGRPGSLPSRLLAGSRAQEPGQEESSLPSNGPHLTQAT